MQSGINSEAGFNDAGTDATDSFDVMPTSLWLEDYSQLRLLFDSWHNAGVTDLRRFLLEDPRRIAACSSSIRILRVNQCTLSLYAADSFDELASRLDEVLRDDMLEQHVAELEQLWSGQTTFHSKSVNYALDGRRLDILLKGVVLPDYEARWDRVLITVDDITALETARRRTTDSELYARNIFQHAPVSLWVEDFSAIKALLDEVREQGITDFRTFTDVHPEFVERCMTEIQVMDINRYTLDMFKARDKPDLLSRLSEIFRDDMWGPFREQLLDLWEGRLFQQREVLNYALDGTAIHIHLQFSVFAGHEKDWSLVLLALTDISARKKAEAYLEYLGKHDVLTKLKNRSFYVDELSRLERRGPFPITTIIVDVNGLKTANDRLGHAAGDALLRRTGEVLAQSISKPFHAARIGGDEFAITMPGAGEHEGEAMIQSILKLVDLNNQFYPGPALNFSIGVATCHRGERLEETLHKADLAMYEDKRNYYAARHEDRRQG